MNRLFVCVAGFSTLLLSSLVLAQSGLSSAIVSLNADRDSILSNLEIQQAPSALLSLDSDGSGELEANEIELRTSNLRRRRNNNVRDLVLGALDVNVDGMISVLEIEASAWRLLALDADNSGSLSNDELNPFGANIARNGNRGGNGRRGGGSARQATIQTPEQIPFEDGAARLADRETFERLSYQGPEVLIDAGLAGIEFIKFYIIGANTQNPQVYFMNTETYRAHMMFTQAFNIGAGNSRRGTDGQQMRGVLAYRPHLNTASGEAGLYTFEFEPFDIFDYSLIQIAYDQLIQNAPILAGKLAYHPMPAAVSRYEEQREQFEVAELAVFLDEDEYADIAYLPLNEAEGFGMLRQMELDERPGVRDVVLYESIPNEMPHVAGIISGFRQTPLSHVNLRAVQDSVPNAYIKDVLTNENIMGLVDRYIYYKVESDGFEIREASLAEVDAHFAGLRPVDAQFPDRDLTNTSIRPLDDVIFADSDSVGVKASNVATLHNMDLPAGVAPDGFAMPFYFYDEFMKHNDFYMSISEMMEQPDFATETDERDRALMIMREEIEAGDMPDWMMNELAELQAAFPTESSIRLRSSTNNEDLPGFSGAGLYDSYTHNPDEGHIANSAKQVFASLWNFRAYEEREFYRIDHFSAAMGVLVHPNYSDEKANGVAVSDEVVYQVTGETPGRTYYVNVQLGEDLITNPDEASIPEELLLNSVYLDMDRLIQKSNRNADALLLDGEYKTQLRHHMNRIHHTFRELYNIETDAQFAMEIEFKITAEGNLAIKQARPWVY